MKAVTLLVTALRYVVGVGEFALATVGEFTLVTVGAFALVTVGAFALATPAVAQIYSYSPNNADELPGNVYFGAAKDNEGHFLSGVTVVLKTAQADFVLVTDETGRFRMKLPVKTKPADVAASCSRRGYALVKAVKRTPRGQAVTPVEVNCVLRLQP